MGYPHLSYSSGRNGYVWGIGQSGTGMGTADMAMGFMTICNLIAITLLGKYAFRLLEDYRIQKRNGVKNPVFTKDRMKDIENDLECW